MFRKGVVQKEEEAQVLAKKVQPFKLSDATTLHLVWYLKKSDKKNITLDNGAEEKKMLKVMLVKILCLHKFKHICQVRSWF